MITHLTAKGFAGVPYLESSLLMANHPDGVAFATDKPNVIIGPNGAGKSALMNTLALRTLSFSLGESTFDSYFFSSVESRRWWSSKPEGWTRDYLFLQGLNCTTDNAAAMYYRPAHIPGNEKWAGAAMMTYGEKAEEYREKVRDRSSGQRCQSLLEKVITLLDGSTTELQYQYFNWGYGTSPRKLKYDAMEYEHKAEILKSLVDNGTSTGVPTFLADEPEQSLDAKAELELWKKIADADTSRIQSIVATHSLYPVLHPDRFHIIEAVPGYLDDLRSLLYPASA